MSNIIYKYPLDLTGNNPENRAVNERYEIGSTNYRILISEHGPFYGNTIIVKNGDTGDVLVPHDDYILIHQVREAQEITGQPVYCGVRITNPDIGTKIELDLSYVGGEFSYSTKALISMLNEIKDDNRPIEWGGLIGIPNEWVPAPHLHSAYDLYAMKHLVGATTDVAFAIREGHVLQAQMLFEMIDDRISLFESIIPAITEAYQDATENLMTLI